MHTWSASRTADALQAGEASAVEVVEALLARIEQVEPALGAFLTVDPEGARAAAAASDARRARGAPLSRWDGVPVTVKDLVATAGLRTTYGSAAFAEHVPTEDDTVVARLRAAGTVILGKTNTPELGASAETFSDVGPRCANPWDRTRTAGGSSGGSGAALAAGLGAWSIGTDGGGSIRLPSAWCGVYGLKVTRRVVPDGGPGSPPAFNPVVSAGPMARTAGDAAALFDIVAGPAAHDPLSALSWRDRAEPGDGAGAPLRAACSWTLGLGAPSAEVGAILRAAVAAVEGAGELAAAEVDLDLSDPHPIGALFPLIGLGQAQLFGDAYGATPDRFCEPGRQFVQRGLSLTGTEVAAALRDGEVLEARVDAIFAEHDVLITPATAVPAWPHDDPPDEIDGRPVADWRGVRYGALPYLGPFNLTGHPAVIAPVGFDAGGLPVAVQIVGPRHAERRLLEAARRFERVLGVPTLAPDPAASAAPA